MSLSDVPEIITDHDRKPVTCERCGTVWWVDYQDALAGMQSGKLWIKHRPVRKNQTAFLAGTLESEPYMAGLCFNCDKGIVRPPVEVESMLIARRVKHFEKLVDPENAVSYAVEEYNDEFMRTFQPEFYRWYTQERPLPAAEVDFSLLPPEFLGEEDGYEDGSRKCPHVNPPIDWSEYNPLNMP